MAHEIPLSQAIEQQLTNEKNQFVNDTDPLLPVLQDFYFQRGYKPVWFGKKGINIRGRTLLDTIRQADTHGLNSDDYHIDYFRSHSLVKSSAARAEMELLMSNALMRYIQHMQTGRLDPQSAGLDWHIDKPEVDVGLLINQLLRADDFKRALDSLAPRFPGYQRLRSALRKYLALQASGGWPTLAEGPTLRINDENKQVAILKHRLQAEGDLKGVNKNNTYLFDDKVKQAVKQFQMRYGIKDDGEVGTATRIAMNVPVSKRIEQLKLNLERWRWLPRNLGDHYILVNTAAYELTVYKHDLPLLSHRAIVGMPKRPTPVISGTVQRVELNPYWYIPPIIATRDMIPQQMQNPEFFKSMDVQVFHRSGKPPGELDPAKINWSVVSRENFPYILRQQPGPLNMLGRIKIIFTNKYSLYLHDTPKTQLFKFTTRAFSSGCIRVENPLDLAAYLLRYDTSWTKQHIQEAVDSLENISIELKTPVPVYLIYWTAGVGDDGKVYFRKDIYGWDTSQSQCR